MAAKPVLSIRPRLGGAPQIILRVDGRLTVPTEKVSAKCASCGASVKSETNFAAFAAAVAAGGELAGSEIGQGCDLVDLAPGGTLCIIRHRLVLFFVTKSRDGAAFAKLSTMNPSDTFSARVNGVRYTVAELRDTSGNSDLYWRDVKQSAALFVGLLATSIVLGIALRFYPPPGPQVAASFAKGLIVGARTVSSWRRALLLLTRRGIACSSRMAISVRRLFSSHHPLIRFDAGFGRSDAPGVGRLSKGRLEFACDAHTSCRWSFRAISSRGSSSAIYDCGRKACIPA